MKERKQEGSKEGEKETSSSLTNVFKVKVKFKAMHTSTVMPSLNAIA